MISSWDCVVTGASRIRQTLLSRLLRFQGARCVVMAGDPAQLPPTVTSREAVQQHQLSVTLFERLQRALGLEPLLLDTQYRMNPHISGFPRCVVPL